MLRVTRRPLRCYVFGHRVHHGLVGLLGVGLCLHDAKDWRRWIADLIAEPTRPQQSASITYVRTRRP